MKPHIMKTELTDIILLCKGYYNGYANTLDALIQYYIERYAPITMLNTLDTNARKEWIVDTIFHNTMFELQIKYPDRIQIFVDKYIMTNYGLFIPDKTAPYKICLYDRIEQFYCRLRMSGEGYIPIDVEKYKIYGPDGTANIRRDIVKCGDYIAPQE